MKPYRIAFIPLLRTTFDVDYAHQMIAAARLQLQKAGFELVEFEQAITDQATAKTAANSFDQAALDLVVIFQSTFADSSMVTALAEGATAPVFLWAVPEPWTGERLRLNSLCGINLAGHALTLRQIKFDYGFGLPDDQAVIEKIQMLAAVGSLGRKLQSARFGVVGEHPAGFESCHLDEAKLKSTFGVQIERISLADVFKRSRAISEDRVISIRKNLDQTLDNLITLDQPALKGTLQVYAALRDLSIEKDLAGLAVRCWPEFFTELGCAACGAMSMLSDGFGQAGLLPCSCEADINGTLTQFILQSLSGGAAFGTDMVGVDTEQDQIAIWHCGLAPLSMADPDEQPHGTIHSNRHLPLLMDFTLKPGPVTIARISQADGDLRLVMGSGEMLRAPKPFSGTAGTLRLNYPAKRFLDLLIHQGLEHHISLTYGHFVNVLKNFAEWNDLPILLLDEKGVMEN